jgi:hypothetical protein
MPSVFPPIEANLVETDYRGKVLQAIRRSYLLVFRLGDRLTEIYP